jgi:hypothetical protein
MKASVGDRIVVIPSREGQPPRDGRILEVRNEDGSPPYLIEWSDNGHKALCYPGGDAHIQHFGEPDEPAPDPGTRRTWHVELDLFEVGRETTARAVLVGSAPAVEAVGRAQRNPHDPDVPVVGDEVAAARALRRLADRLLGEAANDIATREGHLVRLHP